MKSDKRPNQRDLATDAGMLCIWDPRAFSMVVDYETWESQLLEDDDILRHIREGHLVPLKMGDGAFSVEVRFGDRGSLSLREKEYLLVSSLPYRFCSTGHLCVSGIEHVGADSRFCLDLPLEIGDYRVWVHMIDWVMEPGSQDHQGNPTETALPDMIVCVRPEGETTEPVRIAVETFRQEDARR